MEALSRGVNATRRPSGKIISWVVFLSGAHGDGSFFSNSCSSFADIKTALRLARLNTHLT